MSSAYNFSLTTFNPTGKLVQIEYALNAVNSHGALAIGIKFNDGVVICAERKQVSPTIDISSLKKVDFVSDKIGVTYAGMPADFRCLLQKARKIAVDYEHMYGEPVPLLHLIKQIANIVQEYTQSGGVRPFGCSLLFCGFDNDGFGFYQLDPSGAYFAWKATAIGKQSVNARKTIDNRYRDNLSVEDAIHAAILTVKDHAESNITEKNIEFGIAHNGKFTVLSPEEIAVYIKISATTTLTC